MCTKEQTQRPKTVMHIHTLVHRETKPDGQKERHTHTQVLLSVRKVH